MLFRRALVETVGLLDEDFGSGNFEDDDYCLRAALQGHQNMIAGDVFVHHHGSRSFVANGIDYSASIGANKKIFAEKWSGIRPESELGRQLIAVTAMETGGELHQLGKHNEAMLALTEGIGYAPEDKRLYYALAEMLLDAKRFQDALEALNAMPDGETCPRALALTGYCEEGLNRLDEAGVHADEALFADSGFPLALNLKGVLAHRQGDNIEAESFFRRAVEKDPGYGEPYTNMGVLKWAAGQREEALALLERGCLLSPASDDNVNVYHTAVTETGAFDRAGKILAEAKALHPRNRRIGFLYIDVLIQQGKNDRAMAEIEEAMIVFGVDDGLLTAALEIRGRLGPKGKETGSSHPGAISLCMIVRDEEKQITRCLQSVKHLVDEIIVIDTGSSDKTKEIARAFGARVHDFSWTQDFSEARNYGLSKAAGDWILVLDADEVIAPVDHRNISRLVSKKSAGPSAYSFVTRNYTTQAGTQGLTVNDGRYLQEEAGIGWFPSSKVRLFPNQKSIRFENPVHEFVEGTLKRAGVMIKECQVPIHHYGRLNLDKTMAKGEAYYLLGKKKLEENGEDPKAIFELAVQAGELGRFEEAAGLWEILLRLKPDDPLALFNLGFACMELGDYQKALVSSKKAMEIDPGLKESAVNRSTCELYVGDIKKAISVLEKIVSQAPETYPSAMAALSAAYCIDGQKEDGLALISRLNTKGFDCAPFLEDIGKGLMKSNRTKQALLLFEAAVESRSVSPETGSLLTECYRILDDSLQGEGGETAHADREQSVSPSRPGA
jgi:tetratricopeptide (TPR) repeat protein